ncbi:MAG: hypothetical protein KJ066_20085 [Acidobacteria bacterium]|nr:hypothetical protein [Acidobacteriota bacterium]
METAARPMPFRPELVDATSSGSPAPSSARALVVTATYALSEAGRKASLLAGGDGHTVQQLDLHVPANRLHLVHVNGRGRAQLKLRPRFDFTSEQRLVRIDALPVYDSPPAADDLLRDAARNHQLEQAYHAERTATRAKRAEAERARRTELATAFLSDETQRAVVHPAPSPTRCYLATRFGRMRFDVDTDEGPARDVPREALRRFRADVNEAKARRARERAEHLRIHDERRSATAAWVAAHGTADQQARLEAGLLPMAEVVEAMADEAFRPLADRPRYRRDGQALMQAHVQQWIGQPVDVAPADFTVIGHPARSATSRQWAILQAFKAVVPDAVVHLHCREFTWTRDRAVPRLTRLTVVVTKKVGAMTLRREYLLPDAEDHVAEGVDATGAVMTDV